VNATNGDPAGTLRAATAQLREGVEHCAPESHNHFADGRNVAVLSPLMAASLAALLETAADAVNNYGDQLEFVKFDSTQPPAYRFTYRLIHDGLAVARVILGSED